MGHALPKKQFYSGEEYLEMEESAEYKSEYYDGEIFAMSGGTYKHSEICSSQCADSDKFNQPYTKNREETNHLFPVIFLIPPLSVIRYAHKHRSFNEFVL